MIEHFCRHLVGHASLELLQLLLEFIHICLDPQCQVIGHVMREEANKASTDCRVVPKLVREVTFHHPVHLECNPCVPGSSNPFVVCNVNVRSRATKLK
jgi:hypothetical protein